MYVIQVCVEFAFLILIVRINYETTVYVRRFFDVDCSILAYVLISTCRCLVGVKNIGNAIVKYIYTSSVARR